MITHGIVYSLIIDLYSHHHLVLCKWPMMRLLCLGEWLPRGVRRSVNVMCWRRMGAVCWQLVRDLSCIIRRHSKMRICMRVPLWLYRIIRMRIGISWSWGSNMINGNLLHAETYQNTNKRKEISNMCMRFLIYVPYI